MKLKAIQQVHISAIRSDTIRPGEVVDVDDDRGAELLHLLPDTFEKVAEPAAELIPEPAAVAVHGPAKRPKGRGGAKA